MKHDRTQLGRLIKQCLWTNYARVAFLEGQLKIRTEENRRKDHLLAAALERIPAIEAPSEERGSPETDAAGRPDTSAPTQQQTPAEVRPWWRRMFGG